MQVGGRLSKKHTRRAKASEAYDRQEFAEIRHTEARSLGTEKVGHAFKNMSEVR